MELCVKSCIHGYHVYKQVWTAVFGEELYTEQELGNVFDCYVIAVKKDSGETVGHLPKKISRICSTFIQEGGEIMCTVIGNQKIFIWFGAKRIRNSLPSPVSRRRKVHTEIKKANVFEKKLKHMKW